MARVTAAPPAVPFLDLRSAHAPLSGDFLRDVAGLLESSAFVNGPQVAEFEQAFAEYVGTEHCVGVASGLDALRLALMALELQRGDEVIVPAMTFVATLEAVTQAGGTPVVVDIGEQDWNVDPPAVERASSDRTRAVLPVHLYGQMADMEALTAFAQARGIAIVEDACQAHGATRDGAAAGTLGIASGFSFYPGKNLGAFGDAGALVTNDAKVADFVRAAREHGQRRKYEHDLEGYTARLDTIHALALLHKLPLLDAGNARRRTAAAFYLDALRAVGDLELPPVPAGSEPVWHLFVVRTARPEELADHLSADGIACGRHYPQPVHLTAAYKWLGFGAGDFPVAERHAERCLSLPIFPEISEAQLERVVSSVKSYFARG